MRNNNYIFAWQATEENQDIFCTKVKYNNETGPSLKQFLFIYIQLTTYLRLIKAK